MSNRKRNQERRIRVRAVRHNPPDLKKLAGALIELARAQAGAREAGRQGRAAVAEAAAQARAAEAGPEEAAVGFPGDAQQRDETSNGADAGHQPTGNLTAPRGRKRHDATASHH